MAETPGQRSLGALETAILNGTAAVALHGPPRRRDTAAEAPADDRPIRVLDIQQIPLTPPNLHRVSVLISDDEGALLALGLIGNLLGLRSNGPSAGQRLEEQVIQLTESEVYGRGQRKWFACPGLPGRPCGTRRMKLYLPPGECTFACTECHAIVVPHTPERPLRWRGASLRQLPLHWREPFEMATPRSA